ncbi:MAG TPA: signal peptidase II [Terriglobia bacterium]|nr:signal peptidase II [Terriglobia bacterium]
MSRSRNLIRLIYVLIAAVTFVADQVTKGMIERRLGMFEVVPVIPHFFNLTRSQNPGAAFGLFADSPAPWKTVLLVIVSALLIGSVVGVAWRSHHIDWKSGVGLALILGGAMSNLLDRIRFGEVVDFLDVYFRGYHWYTFNLADAAIVAGAFLLILRVGFSSDAPQPASAKR